MRDHNEYYLNYFFIIFYKSVFFISENLSSKFIWVHLTKRVENLIAYNNYF